MNRQERLRMDAVNTVLKVVLVTVLTLLTVIGCGFMALDGGHPLWLSLGFVVWTRGVCLIQDLRRQRSEAREKRSAVNSQWSSGREDEEDGEVRL